MKTLYFDLSMGAAGDMITAALLGLFDDPDKVCEELNSLGIPDVVYVCEHGSKCGISGLHMRVEIGGAVEGEEEQACRAGDHAGHHHGNDHNHGHHHGCDSEHREHHHAKLADIEGIIDSLDASKQVKANAISIFNLIAQAESTVHGEPVDQIHFHEVGTMDAVADVVAASYLIERLGVESICASDICTGTGSVECAHGVLPVPAPATAMILKGLPVYGGDIAGELCTPTGAAIIKHFVSKFASMPSLRIEAVGYGLGTKDFPRANCLRAILGETTLSASVGDDIARTDSSASSFDDEVVELSCNIDDMTGEALGFVLEQLMEAGALDTYIIPIMMKKSRPAYMLCAIVSLADEVRITKRIFELTSTIGIRRCVYGRYTLDRGVNEAAMRYGKFRVKTASGYGVERRKIEYDDLARFAEDKGISLDEARRLVEKELF